MPLYTTEDLRRYLASTQEQQAPSFDPTAVVSPIVAELRRLGELIVDHSAPQILPG